LKKSNTLLQYQQKNYGEVMLFEKLKNNNIEKWNAYINHIFANKLVNQTLKQENFDFYLEQDYYYLLTHYEAISKLSVFQEQIIVLMRWLHQPKWN